MLNKPKILLVDDDPGLLRLLKIRVAASGYEVDAVENGEKALARLPLFQPQVVIADLRMDKMDGMALFEALHDQHPTLPVIILTAHGTIPDAVEATRRGIFAYLTKPFDSKELLEYVAKALRVSGEPPLKIQNIEDAQWWRRDIITRSPTMETVLSRARLVARSQASILIQSASGAGKELLARAIHRAGPRVAKPFVAVNCTAIPESLFESELFGHSKDSFTGAIREYKGLFQTAEGGTLFLDEIGDMPPSFQAKLLWALQEKEVRPGGSAHAVPVDVRIISATHHELEEVVAVDRLREDLYYRLNVVTLQIPPLCRRREDIPLLVAHFLTKVQKDGEEKVKGFSPEAMDLLVEAPWPGNVRQLQNVVEQLVVLAITPIIPASLVHSTLRDKFPKSLSYSEARKRFERDYLLQLLQTTSGNVSRAARLARCDRSKFYKMLRRHQLDPEFFQHTPGRDPPATSSHIA
jgi:Response regulator containing CheY-like receiver, AAA-type ATPase, and DNA-binding domains